MRKEEDSIGEVLLPDDALYGIQAYRASLNFPDHSPFSFEWYKAIGTVKQACFETVKDFYLALEDKYGSRDWPFQIIPAQILETMTTAAVEVAEGKHFEHFIVPAVSGGAGTSINMNVNEIIANRTLQLSGHSPGDYKTVDPIEFVNVFQSTNDVIPTAFKLAVMQLLPELEEAINKLRLKIENIETQTRSDIRIGYTQMQEAVPSSFGRLFSAYSEMLSRDWWRVSKCFERIKVVNLGGGAIGTGIGLPRFYSMEVVQKLQKLTGLPLSKSENLADTTSNLDVFVEVHAILKAHAVNLEKMVSDIRLLASDIVGNHEVTIPERQKGSTIMPGKVNPVIPEFVISAAHRIYSNDQLISSLSAQGCLELNVYLPVIGDALLNSIKLLIASDKTILENLLTGIKFETKISLQRLYCSPAITTALAPYIGYNAAAMAAREMKDKNLNIFEVVESLSLIDRLKLDEILKPENLLKNGFTVTEIIDE